MALQTGTAADQEAGLARGVDYASGTTESSPMPSKCEHVLIRPVQSRKVQSGREISRDL
jgi:hypothetical protein